MMKKLTCFFVAILLLAATACSPPPSGQVKVEGGWIQGTVEDGLTVFKGIPFAAPPVGEFRWKAPQALEKWEGVKQTTEFAPAAFQGGNPPSGKSEDCLYLNVWSPAESAKERIPVLVWIYGGGFSFGSTAEPVYTGEMLARKGVVLVSLAYRVGQLGFLVHPELSAESPLQVSGNYGLAYAEKAGAASLSELRKMAAEDLPGGWGMGSAWPIIDGYVIPDNQYKLYEAGKYNDVPVLIGYNSDEGASFTREDSPEAYVAGVQERYGKYAETLLEAYPVAEEHVPKTARDLARDAAFGWHTWTWARLQSRTGKSKVFYYYFDQHPDFPEDSPRYGHGSPHGQDVAYVFMHLNASDSTTTHSDLAISGAMGIYWTNFAKFGDPSGEGLPEWPLFSESQAEVLNFGPDPHTGPVPSASSLEVLDDYFEWRRSSEGEEWAK